MSLETTWQKAQQVRELFRPIEQKRWGSREYAVELMVQVGHLGDILLLQDYKMNRNTDEANRKIIGDEIVDIILNTFSIADAEGISLPSMLSIKAENSPWIEIIEDSLVIYPDPIDPITLYSELSMKGAAVLRSLVSSALGENLTESLLTITRLLARFAGIYGIDIDTAFTLMYGESQLFVKRYSNAK